MVISSLHVNFRPLVTQSWTDLVEDLCTLSLSLDLQSIRQLSIRRLAICLHTKH